MSINTLVALQRTANIASLLERARRARQLEITCGHETREITFYRPVPVKALWIQESYKEDDVEPFIAGAPAMGFLQKQVIPALENEKLDLSLSFAGAYSFADDEGELTHEIDKTITWIADHIERSVGKSPQAIVRFIDV